MSLDKKPEARNGYLHFSSLFFTIQRYFFSDYLFRWYIL